MADRKHLIQTLSQDLTNPSPSQNWPSQFWFSWISCLSLLALFTYLLAAFFPSDIYLPQHLGSFSFLAQAFLWMTLALLSAWISFRSAHLLTPKTRLDRWGFVVASILILTIFASGGMDNAWAEELHTELDLSRGPCGIFILVMGALASVWMFSIIRRATPTRLIFTGAWSALSVSALGSFFMHLVCRHDNPVHAFIWHFLPVALIVLMGSQAATKALRW